MENNSMKIVDGLNKKRLLVLLGILLISLILFVVVQKTDLIYYLITAPVGPGEQIENRAEVTFEDTQGNKYGPVSSNKVTTQIVQAPTCQGGVPYNTCASNKPKYCQNGNLIDNCSVCGCPSNQVCQVDGSCLTPVQSEPFNVNLKKQGRTDATGPIIIRIYQSGTANLVAEINTNVNSQGKAQGLRFNQQISGGTYDLVIKIPNYLRKKLANVIWPPTQELDFGEILTGNLYDADNVINSSDWAIMSGKWGTADKVSDLNQDGIVNTLDWSLMNKN